MSTNVLDKVGFHPVIKRWFTQRFAIPSQPQQRGWPVIAAGQHTLILAPTGSGKTLAAFLWSIDQLLRQSLSSDCDRFSENQSGIHTLYISPLKALNNDIHRNLQQPLKEIRSLAERNKIGIPKIKVAVRTGDTPAHVRQSMLRHPPHILITTPESLYLLLSSKRRREVFRELKYVIVDEIHALSHNKRGVHLSLSLERMTALCRIEPIRIGLSATQRPLARIAAFLGGQIRDDSKRSHAPRSVKTIDCGYRKDMDLRVITPVESFRELPQSSVWQPVYRQLYELIRSHTTTLIFAGMRAQTEKIARALNLLHRQLTGDSQAELALAHHGSISREARYDIEARLKAGKIPAVIATASLELGIDIGSIDLVVLLEAPQSVSGALQRVGRSGHLLSATSKGRIVVLYPADLDDAVAIVRCMVQADIEETRIPDNALDVLAQQMVAEVAVKSWNYDDLFHLVRKSYCYRNLTRSAYEGVAKMLSGKFAGIPLQALKPRLNWDRINNRLIARRGSRLAAIMNGGTIPDRGYYGVFLENTNVKLGEVEEEFAFESRVGEAFYLGNSEWLIKRILQDRIIVSPVAAINPRAPFWKGGIRQRDYATSIKIGQFRQLLQEKIAHGQAVDWLLENGSADENTARNLVAYFIRQRQRGQIIATDRRVVAEITIDSGGEPLLILHAPFGARVNGAWAIAMAAVLETHYGTQFQYSFDDDGILVRLLETMEPPPLAKLFGMSAQEIETNLIKALPQSPVFLVLFRHNAARSLMLPRSRPGKRVPLWLQRLRAADLLQAVWDYKDFPVVCETYRECLQDVFDLTALKQIIEGIGSGRICHDVIITSVPSPMAAGILFKFISVHLYAEDQSRHPRKELNVSGEVLDGMLERDGVPVLLPTELVLQAERRWQHLDPYFQAATAEDLFSIIEKLGPIAEEDLSRRCKVDPVPLLNELKAANRIILSSQQSDKSGKRAWHLAESKRAISGDDDPADVTRKIQRYLSTRGPVKIDAIKSDLALPHKSLSDTLNRMLTDKLVIHGFLIEGRHEKQWCDRHNYNQLYRTAIVRRRTVQKPADRRIFYRFLLHWHGVTGREGSVRHVIKRYRGYRFPLYFFEREILRSRRGEFPFGSHKDRLSKFESLISNGEVIVISGRNNDTGRKYVEFRMRGEGRMYCEQEILPDSSQKLSPFAKIVFDFLHENGASYGRDLEMGAGLTSAQLQRALQELAETGLASCENYPSFLLTFQSTSKRKSDIRAENRINADQTPWSRYKRSMRPSQSEIRKSLRRTNQLRDSRWFLTNSLAVLGKLLDENQRAERQARLLLQRYGILIKEWYRRENGLLPWHELFQLLKRWEWQGEIRRGYFVSGLSGVQFALPQAVELLEQLDSATSSSNDDPILLSSLDPALPFGGVIDWKLIDITGNPIRVVRSAANHLVVLNGGVVMVGENFFQRLSILENMSRPTWRLMTKSLHEYLKMPYPLKPANRIEIHRINSHPAAGSPIADDLIESGFEKDGAKLVLWPSAA